MAMTAPEIPISEKLGLTVAEAAALLGVSYPIMIETSRRADFPKIKMGRNRIVIPRKALEAWMEKEAGLR